MNLKSRTTTAIIIGIVLIVAGILIWARQTGKITIFGDQVTQDQSAVLFRGTGGTGDGNIIVENNTIKLKPTTSTSTSNGSWTWLGNNDKYGTGFINPPGPIGATIIDPRSSITKDGVDYRNQILLLANSDSADNGWLSSWIMKTDGGATYYNNRTEWPWARNTILGSPALNFNYVDKTKGYYAISGGAQGGLPISIVYGWNNGKLEPITANNDQVIPDIHYGTNQRTQSVADGASIYVAGGYNDRGNNREAPKFSNRLQIFNLDSGNSGTWLTGLGQFPQELSARDGVGAAAVPDKNGRGNDRIYIYGGHNNSNSITEGNFFSDFYYYQIDNGTWHPVSTTQGPGARGFGKMVYDSTNDQLIYFGGNNGGSFSNDIWKFNLQNSIWETIPTSGQRPDHRSMPEMLYNQSNNKIYLLGGYRDAGNPYRDFWEFTIPQSTTTTTYPASGVFTSSVIGGDNVEKFVMFDRAHQAYPEYNGTGVTDGANIQGRDQIDYLIYDLGPNGQAENGGGDDALLKSARNWENYLNFSDPSQPNYVNLDEKAGHKVKRIYVQIGLQSDNGSTSPWTQGFVVRYNTNYLPTKPVPSVSAQASTTECQKATVTWEPSSDRDVSGYLINWGLNPDPNNAGGIELGKDARSFNFNDSLMGNTKYYVWVMAKGPGGVSEPVRGEFTTVACPVAPVITAFSATPLTITAGQSSSLSWTITGADSASIDNGVGPVDKAASGTNPKLVPPTQTTTYTLTATNSVGFVTKSVTVIVNQPQVDKPVITKFTAEPLTVNKGSESKLIWTITNATSASIDPDIGSVDKTQGEKAVVVNEEKEYTLTATNSSGSVTAKVKISLTGDNQAPTAPTNLTGIPVGNGGIDLTWNPSTDNIGVTGYAIYDATNNNMIGSTTDTKYSLRGLNCNSTYKFYVRAYDAASNLSEKSNIVEVKTGACTGAVGESVPSGSAGIPAKLASTTKLVSTGGALWFNILIALILAGGIGYFLLRRRKEN